MGRDYSRLAGLKHVLLEDSWMLNFAPSEHQITFRVEAALLPSHEAYTDPKPGEAYCYRPGWLILTSSEAISVELSGARPAVDASGTTDLGNIDDFAEVADGVWVLEGDWGRATVHAPHTQFLLD